MGDYYETEPDYRKDYISNWALEATGLVKSDNLEDYKRKFNKLKQKEELTQKEKDLLRYFEGESNKDFLFKDTFKRAKQTLDLEIDDDLISVPINKGLYLKEKNKEYQVLYNDDGKTVKKVDGFIKGKKVKARVERYIKNGKIHTRLRDDKGRIASKTLKE